MNTGSATPVTPVAIVTGISRGYGRAVAQALVQAQWLVVGDGRDEETLDNTAKMLASPGRLFPILGDINDNLHLSAMVESARSRGRLKLVVNNAGTLGP